MNTQEQAFADFFQTHSHGDKTIMAAMLDALLQGNQHQGYRRVVQAGYIAAMK